MDELMERLNTAVAVLELAADRLSEREVAMSAQAEERVERIVATVEGQREAELAERLRTAEAKLHEAEARIAELESALTGPNAVVTNSNVPQKSDVADMIAAEIKKRAEPRFEALERAMRRYEKRSTTLSMLMEQRLNIHEAKLGRAIV